MRTHGQPVPPGTAAETRYDDAGRQQRKNSTFHAFLHSVAKRDETRSEKATTWLINTYIDEDTRIARGDGGSVFVMVKEEEEELAQRASTVEEIDAVEERRQAAGAVKEVEAEALIDE